MLIKIYIIAPIFLSLIRYLFVVSIAESKELSGIIKPIFCSETPQSGASCLRKLSRRPSGHGPITQWVECSGARPRASANSSLGNLIACFRKQLAEQSYPPLLALIPKVIHISPLKLIFSILHIKVNTW